MQIYIIYLRNLWMRIFQGVHADVILFDVTESLHSLILMDAEIMPPTITRKAWTNLAVCPPSLYRGKIELHYLKTAPG